MCLGMSHDIFIAMHRSDEWQSHFDGLCCDASEGWWRPHEYSPSCYDVRATNTAATWLEAQEACAAKGGHLLQLTNANEMDEVRDQLGSAVGDLWLGYDDVHAENAPECDQRFGACDSTYTNWDDENHGNTDAKDCVYTFIDPSGASKWRFAECDDPTVAKRYVCEKPISCPDKAYPCYFQADNDLDWCDPLELLDPVCENNGFPAAMPSLSVGYMYYLYKAYHGPSPAAQMVTLSMPCDATDAQSYPITFFKARMLFVDGVGTDAAGGLGDGETPIGVRTPLTAADPDAFAHRHGVCVNLRAEVQAEHLDRTMIEVTHCCGTADYSKATVQAEIKS